MKASERLQADIERLEKLRKTVEASPLTKQALEAEAAETLARRKAAAARLTEIEAEAAARIPALIDDLAGKEAEQREHEARGRTIHATAAAARQALSRARLDYDGDKRQATAELLNTYDPRIDEAEKHFNERLEWLRQPGRTSRTGHKSEFNIFRMAYKTKQESNREAVLTALKYCQDAIAELGKMKLEPDLDPARIEALKAGIPSIDVYSEFTGEKPSPRAVVDPMIGLPSDDQLDWKFKKLMDRVTEHLKTPTPAAKREAVKPAEKKARTEKIVKTARHPYLDDYKNFPGRQQFR